MQWHMNVLDIETNRTSITRSLRCPSPAPRLCSSDPTWCFPCVMLRSGCWGEIWGDREERGGGGSRGWGHWTLLPLGRLLSFTSNVLRAYKRYLLNLHRKLRKHAVIMYAPGTQSISHNLESAAIWQTYRLHEPPPTFDALTLAYKKKTRTSRVQVSLFFALMVKMTILKDDVRHCHGFMVNMWTIHPSIAHPLQGRGGSRSQLTLAERRGAPWTGRQFTREPIHFMAKIKYAILFATNKINKYWFYRNMPDKSTWIISGVIL